MKPALNPQLPARLKIRQLTLLVHLDEQRSILRAAEAANMTQPAASKLLAELEETLGAPLFLRHARGVEPTACGEVLIRHARNALLELRHAQSEVADLKAGLTGHASIGTVVTSSTSLVPLAVATLKARSPRLLVNIELGFSEDLMRALLAGKLDIIVARVYRPEGLGEFEFEPFGEEPHAMYARAEHPLMGKWRLELKHLIGQTWVLPPRGNVLRARLSALFLAARLDPPKQVVETSALPIIISLLQMSEMVSALPCEVLRPYCEVGILKRLPIDLDLRLGDAGIITRRGQDLSPGAREMLVELRAAAASLHPRSGAPPVLPD